VGSGFENILIFFQKIACWAIVRLAAIPPIRTLRKLKITFSWRCF